MRKLSLKKHQVENKTAATNTLNKSRENNSQEKSSHNSTNDIISLHSAILDQNFSKIKSYPGDVNIKDQNGNTSIHTALVSSIGMQYNWNGLELYHASPYMAKLLENQNTLDKLDKMLDILYIKGVIIDSDIFNLNPLETIYYTNIVSDSTRKSILKSIQNKFDIQVTILTRFFLWTIVHCRCLTKYKQQCLENHDYFPNHCVISLTNAFKDTCLISVKHGIIIQSLQTVRKNIEQTQVLACNPKDTFKFLNFSHEMLNELWKNEIYFKSYSFMNTNSKIPNLSRLYLKLNLWNYFWDAYDPQEHICNWKEFKTYILTIGKDNIDQLLILLHEILKFKINSATFNYSKTSLELCNFLQIIGNILNCFIQSKSKTINESSMINFDLFYKFFEKIIDILENTHEAHGIHQSKILCNFSLLLVKFLQLLNFIYTESFLIPENHFEKLQELFSKTIPLRDKNFSYWRALRVDTQCEMYGLDKRAFFAHISRIDPNLNARSHDTGRTLLQDVLMTGDIYLVQALIQSGANPFIVDNNGKSFIESLNDIIVSLGSGPASELYEDVRNTFTILIPPFPLRNLAAIAFVKHKIPFDVIKYQPRLYNFVLSHMAPQNITKVNATERKKSKFFFNKLF